MRRTVIAGAAILLILGLAIVLVPKGVDPGESPKSVLRDAAAARLAQARREDRRDRAWLKESRRVMREVARERGITEFEAFLHYAQTSLPPRPAGFEERMGRCNLAGRQRR